MQIGSDYGPMNIDFNPDKYKTAKGMAKGLYDALAKISKDWGQDPDIEMALWSPEEADSRGYGKAWMVCWESGPFEWAITASFNITGKVWAEPYYSFNLSFYED